MGVLARHAPGRARGGHAGVTPTVPRTARFGLAAAPDLCEEGEGLRGNGRGATESFGPGKRSEGWTSSRSPSSTATTTRS